MLLNKAKLSAGLVAIAVSSSVYAKTSEEDARDAFCYVYLNAPEYIYGEAPFSCEKKGGRFIAQMDEEIASLKVMQRSNSLPDGLARSFPLCVAELGKKKQRVNVARQFYKQKDSPILSRNASMAMAISSACDELITPAQSAPKALTGPQKNAIRSAKRYLENGAFSRNGLIWQLSSKIEGYDYSDAQFAVDSLNVNWKSQAERQAKWYLRNNGFSCQGLINQLSSEAEKFTQEEAIYGANKTDACH